MKEVKWLFNTSANLALISSMIAFAVSINQNPADASVTIAFAGIVFMIGFVTKLVATLD